MKLKSVLQCAVLCFTVSAATIMTGSFSDSAYSMTDDSQLEADFEEAKVIARQLFDSGRLSNSDKAELYGFYKQATEGDNPNPRPKGFNFVAKAKWDAWSQNKSMSRHDAKFNYIELVRSLSSH